MNRLLHLFFLIAVASFPGWAADAASNPRLAEKKAFEEASDILSIRHSPTMRRDTSEVMIRIPEDYPEVRDFDVAKTPPAIDFAIVQGLEPQFLPEPGTARSTGAYGGWGDVTKDSRGRFFFAIGNHMSYDGGNAFIVRYDPATKEQAIVLNTKELIGWGPDDYADGKLHGDLDIAPNGDMWALTYFGPRPTPKDWDTTYRGSWLLRYNVFSGEKENLGIALEGESWPYHNWDWERDLFFGVGHNKGVFVYDTKARKMLYGGAPPNGIEWNHRGILIDRDTGVIYTTDVSASKENKGRFVKYIRRNNQFVLMKARVPDNPVTGENTLFRAHTEKKDAEGAFWGFDFSGTFFKFYPKQDRTELVGVNWGKSGKYTTNISTSPGGRYLYYLPGADRRAYEYGTPVVQYDTRTNRKKVIAFLYDYYLDKYGYAAFGTYGLELDEKGESLFLFMDGRFTTRQIKDGVRRPAIFHVHIPESERVE